MIGIVGIVIAFVMVFGGFLLAGGKLGVVLAAMPFELMIIGGAALGAFLLANGGAVSRQTLRQMGKVFSGPKWQPADYRDLLCLLFELIRIGRTNPVVLEEHVEQPETSAIFARYPKIRADQEAVDLICDTLRVAAMNYDDPHQVEEVLDKRMETTFHGVLNASRALQVMADGLPALGIVAAVLGVIKTMSSVDQPPEVLGRMIGSALVGTFLGVFLSYGLVGPFANKLKGAEMEDRHFYTLIREVLVANLHRHPANICVEVGRQNTPRQFRPSFSDLEAALRNVPQEVA